MALITLSLILARVSLQVCHPSEEPSGTSAEAEEKGVSLWGEGLQGQKRWGSTLPAVGQIKRE